MGTSVSHITGRSLWSRNSPDKSELSERMGRWTIGLTDDLGYKEIYLRYAQKYHQLGWALAALDERGITELPNGSGDPEDSWTTRLAEIITANGPINLGVRTGTPSRLLVLEVEPGAETFLVSLGHWQSHCIAQAEGGSQQHYFALPQECHIPNTLALSTKGIKVFGQGGLTLVPPSIAPGANAPWRWLTPPWDIPPGLPSPTVWQFLRDQAPLKTEPEVEWGQYPLPTHIAGNDRNQKPFSLKDREALEHLKELTFSLYRQLHESPKVAAFKAALREHLEENPEMAADLEKVEMLQYCLYTYCRIHPDFADFTPKERVQEASRMACEFLNQLARYMQGFLKK